MATLRNERKVSGMNKRNILGATQALAQAMRNTSPKIGLLERSLRNSVELKKYTRCTLKVRQISSELKSSGAIWKLSGFFPGY